MSVEMNIIEEIRAKENYGRHCAEAFHTLFNSIRESRSILDFADLDEEVKRDDRKALDDSMLFLE